MGEVRVGPGRGDPLQVRRGRLVQVGLGGQAGPGPHGLLLQQGQPGSEDLAELRASWPGQLLVKGPLGAADARRAIEAGADGIQLSNHGGRQLDRTVAPIDLVAEVREAVGPGPAVLVDSGIRHGSDLAVAVALGADAGMIGRAYLYGLMAGGEPGVDRVLELLAAQFQRTMQLLGVTSVAELRKEGPNLLTRG